MHAWCHVSDVTSLPPMKPLPRTIKTEKPPSPITARPQNRLPQNSPNCRWFSIGSRQMEQYSGIFMYGLFSTKQTKSMSKNNMNRDEKKTSKNILKINKSKFAVRRCGYRDSGFMYLILLVFFFSPF